MPKVKPHRTSPSLDMTPMVDLAFLLVTFFMLTTKFAPEETVVVDTPSSISELKLPESNVITLTIDNKKRVFFGVDDPKTKIQALQRVGAKYGSTSPAGSSEREVRQLATTLAFPSSKLGASYLNVEKEETQAARSAAALAFPSDSAQQSKLIDWGLGSRANRHHSRRPPTSPIKGDWQRLTCRPVQT
jgi:hypothetical protein